MEASGRFGRLPWAAIEAGLLRELTGTELKVYVATVGHANRDWLAHPGSERIARLLGLKDDRSVRRALAGLVEKGFLAIVSQGGGRSLATTYRVIENPVTRD